MTNVIPMHVLLTIVIIYIILVHIHVTSSLLTRRNNVMLMTDYNADKNIMQYSIFNNTQDGD